MQSQIKLASLGGSVRYVSDCWSGGHSSSPSGSSNILLWRLMSDLGMQVSVHPSVFLSTFTLCVLWAQLLLQLWTDHFETLQVFFPWYEDVHVVWIELLDYFLSLFPHCELNHFSPQYISTSCECNSSYSFILIILKLCMFSSWYVHVVWV